MLCGASNWRGPVWFPIGGLSCDIFGRCHAADRDGFTVEGSGAAVS